MIKKKFIFHVISIKITYDDGYPLYLEEHVKLKKNFLSLVTEVFIGAPTMGRSTRIIILYHDICNMKEALKISVPRYRKRHFYVHNSLKINKKCFGDITDTYLPRDLSGIFRIHRAFNSIIILL